MHANLEHHSDNFWLFFFLLCFRWFFLVILLLFRSRGFRNRREKLHLAVRFLLYSAQHLQWIRFFSLHYHFMRLAIRYHFLHPVKSLQAVADFPSATLAMHVHP
uniref:Uncharacterized protein n=1 Tax=Opuntia streptacantha TaxID=393608 RepID=A0A7C8YG14_OPUST